jgi:hypothetical protein
MSWVSQVIGYLGKQATAKPVDAAEKGLEYFVKVAEVDVWALETNNTAALAAVKNIETVWMAETVAESGNLLPQVTEWVQGALIGDEPSYDPWIGSRQLTDALVQAYQEAMPVPAPPSVFTTSS